MSQTFIVTGSIEFSGDRDLLLEGRVDAYDRDLPSLERRGDTPQFLGQSLLEEGRRFKIEFTDEQFRRGEGKTGLLRRASKISPDLHFRVFDGARRELTIIRMVAQNREYRPEQIIFNAPPNLEVEIKVELAPKTDDSEFEQLIALIAPVVEDLPLAELSDEDVVFLTDELGLEQQRDTQQHIEWLRRCALLAQDTQLPIEAFYGWGRKDKPMVIAELAAVPLADLPKVLEKLISLSAEELQTALLAAVEENIIPASFRERVEVIVRQLVRRDQVLHSVVAQLQDEETKEPLADYTVTSFDKDAGDENRGLDITDNKGKFLFDFYVPREISPDAATRRFSFQVVTPQGETVPQGEPTVIDLNRLEGEIVPVKIKLPKPQVPPLEEQLQQAQIQAPPELMEWLRGQEIHTFADIRRRGGRIDSADLPQVDPAIVRQLEALADLDRVSSAVQVNKVLLDKGYDSVLAIADAPYTEFINVVTDEQTTLTALEVARLHVMATVQTNLLNNILAALAADTANGFNLSVQADDVGGVHQ
jgi:hypothetical protein